MLRFKPLTLVLTFCGLTLPSFALADYVTINETNCRKESMWVVYPYDECIANGNDPGLCRASTNLKSQCQANGWWGKKQVAADASDNQCRANYDLAPLHLSNFTDPQLASAAAGFRSANAKQAVARAKAAGYDKDSAYAAAMAQASASMEAADQSFESAKQLVSMPSVVDDARRGNFPTNISCTGAAGAAVCAGVIAQWTAEVSKQTAEIIKCNW